MNYHFANLLVAWLYYTMDLHDFIVYSFMEKYIGLKRVTLLEYNRHQHLVSWSILFIALLFVRWTGYSKIITPANIQLRKLLDYPACKALKYSALSLTTGYTVVGILFDIKLIELLSISSLSHD